MVFDHANGYLSPASAMDAEEFFQAKRDEELGRWRWPENPDWVAIEGRREPQGRTVVVVNEKTLERFWFNELVGQVIRSSQAHEAGRAFFEAHPERKPWADAKDGDIWEFSDGQYLSDKGRFFRLPLVSASDPTWRPAGFASNFTSGRRIFPEEAA